jgi:hypothetical protein
VPPGPHTSSNAQPPGVPPTTRPIRRSEAPPGMISHSSTRARGSRRSVRHIGQRRPAQMNNSAPCFASRPAIPACKRSLRRSATACRSHAQVTELRLDKASAAKIRLKVDPRKPPSRSSDRVAPLAHGPRRRADQQVRQAAAPFGHATDCGVPIDVVAKQAKAMTNSAAMLNANATQLARRAG